MKLTGTVTNLVLCGGVGSRLWPLSRKFLPKQFARILCGKTLFERTVERNSSLASRVMIAANRHQAFLAFNQLEGLGIHRRWGLVEPMGRNTAPAIALSVMLAGSDSIILVTPSDHLILDTDAYQRAVLAAVDLAKSGHIVAFGITPEYPETGFGYIEVEKDPSQTCRVLSFKEKPDEAAATEYVDAGNYYWNSGMFCFRSDVFLRECERCAPELFKAAFKAFINSGGEQARISGEPLQPSMAHMEAMPAVSVDCAVMEKSDKLAVVPCDMGWSDLGSLDALYDYYRAQGEEENFGFYRTTPVNVNSKNNLVMGDARQIALVNVQDLIVVDTPDALLIAKRGAGQKVKHVVEQLSRRKGDESRLVERFPTIERSWGRYTTLYSGLGYMVRRIEIKPGCRTSLQRYHLREEHWTVVSGSAWVQIEKSAKRYYPGQGVVAPMGACHRLENQGNDLLVIIETQFAGMTGDKSVGGVAAAIEESDVERMEDDFSWLG